MTSIRVTAAYSGWASFRCRRDAGFKAQWLKEAGTTPFFRAAVSGDLTDMKLLMAHGADPLLATSDHTTPLMGAAGIGWLDGGERSGTTVLTAERAWL